MIKKILTKSPKANKKAPLPVASKKMAGAEIQAFFEVLSAKNPAPETELYYKNPYTLLIAVILSAQATDAGVNKATPALFQKATTPEEMVALGEDAVKEYIKTIGLYPTKAKNILKCSRQLIDEHQSQVPNTRDALEALAGVGRKTANVILNVIYGLPTIAVDTHIFRVSNRTGLAPGKTPLLVELGLEKRIPKKWLMPAHHLLILHGRYICTARSPKCSLCPVAHLCHYREK